MHASHKVTNAQRVTGLKNIATTTAAAKEAARLAAIEAAKPKYPVRV